ncbi:methyltransferase type 12 [Thozetella sp. PMI_491]|nr:methyltransferase type 12 [Thozetella sp. PMI_491]
MISRPESQTEKFASRFRDTSVVQRYHLRPSYPPETFSILQNLIKDNPSAVLDLGCGTGDIARLFSAHVDRVDAVDVSLPMLEHGKTLPGGSDSKIRWIHSKAETFAIQGPYALITAGQSLHWMDLDVVMPRLSRMLTPNGVLAIATVLFEPQAPWQDEYTKIVAKYSRNQKYVPFNMIPELEKANLFQKLGESRTAPLFMRQTIGDYIESHHARSSFSLDDMTTDEVDNFSQEMRGILQPYAEKDELSFGVVGYIVWGKPLRDTKE